jgi:hypothetical protein
MPRAGADRGPRFPIVVQPRVGLPGPFGPSPLDPELWAVRHDQRLTLGLEERLLRLGHGVPGLGQRPPLLPFREPRLAERRRGQLHLLLDRGARLIQRDRAVEDLAHDGG